MERAEKKQREENAKRREEMLWLNGHYKNYKHCAKWDDDVKGGRWFECNIIPSTGGSTGAEKYV